MKNNKARLGVSDKESLRTYDENGFLHVERSPLTAVQVAEYYGVEFDGWQERGLDPKRKYRVYRSAEALSDPETIKSVNGIPIQLNHHDDYADAPAKDTRVGSTGTDAEFKDDKLWNSLHIFDKKAQDAINSGKAKELSLKYTFLIDDVGGKTPDGEPYDFSMKDIRANHVALVELGRAGHDVRVADSKTDFSHVETKKMDDKDKKPDDVQTVANNTDAPSVKDGEPQVEAMEVALAQAIVDLHKKTPEGDIQDVETGDSEEDPKADTPKAEDADEAKIEELVKGLISHGFPEDKADDLRAALRSLKTPVEETTDAEPDSEPVKEDAPVDDKPADVNDPVEDEEVLLKQAFKDCGLADESGELYEAFKKGAEYADSKTDKEEVKDSEPDCKPQEKTKVGDTAAVIRQGMIDEFNAIEAVKPILGNVKLGAYDSADSVYIAALAKKGFKAQKGSGLVAFKAYMAGAKETAKSAVSDSKPKAEQPSALEKVLNNVTVL